MIELPHEILAEIFLFSTPDGISKPDPKAPPLVLCQVCQYWRDTAIQTPQLWTSLRLVLNYTTLGGARGFHRHTMGALQLWGSRMGVLPASLHLIRNHSLVVIDDPSKFVPIEDVFSHPILRLSRLLALSGFSEDDFTVMSQCTQSTGFPNLRNLSIVEPPGRENDTSFLQFPASPQLQRLSFHCDMDYLRGRQSIATMLPWSTLTHLSASLSILRHEWYIILDECVNLVCASLNLELYWWPTVEPETNTREVAIRDTLRQFSLRCHQEDVEEVFDKFTFPSLTALRICQSNPASLVPIDTLHRVFSAMPALKEVHLQSCTGFGHDQFLKRSGDPLAVGPLSKFVPNLEVLVIDSIGYGAPFASPEDVLKLLHSSWLTADWPASPSRRLEVVIDKGEIFSRSLIEKINAEVQQSKDIPFRILYRRERGGSWAWRQMDGSTVRDEQDLSMKFYEQVR